MNLGRLKPQSLVASLLMGVLWIGRVLCTSAGREDAQDSRLIELPPSWMPPSWMSPVTVPKGKTAWLVHGLFIIPDGSNMGASAHWSEPVTWPDQTQSGRRWQSHPKLGKRELGNGTHDEHTVVSEGALTRWNYGTGAGKMLAALLKQGLCFSISSTSYAEIFWIHIFPDVPQFLKLS